MPAPASSRSVDKRLTFEELVDAASSLVSEEGFDGLSMRKLAKRCGVGAMTLYGYVRTKEELLGALADRYLGEVEIPDGDGVPWQEQVARVFRAVRQAFLQHPELLPIVATQRLEGIGVYRGAELVFRELGWAGLSDQQIVDAFDALTAFTIGSAQRQTGLQDRHAEALPGIRQLPADQFGSVIRLAGLLMTRDPDHDFEAGLDLLIGGITSWAEQ